MGCSSSIAIGFLRGSEKIKKVVCIDGDGSAIMHMGSLFKNGKEKGIIHIILNNDAHDSVGGQPTDAFEIDFRNLGISLGYDFCISTSREIDINNILEKAIKDYDNSYLIDIKVSKGSRADLGRPKEKPYENKKSFMSNWI